MKAVGIDVGGTWIRLFADDMRVPYRTGTTENKDGFIKFLKESNEDTIDSVLVCAVAGLISSDGSEAEITNKNWGVLRADDIKSASGAREVYLVNDLEAVGRGVIDAKRDEPERIVYIAGEMMEDVYEVVIAPGTGIGVAKITPDGKVLAGEGGWMLAQATNEFERKNIEELQKEFKRYVSCEDLAANLSIYRWFKKIAKFPENEIFRIVEESEDRPAKITEFARQGDEVCLRVMLYVAKFLGQCAQNNVLSPPLSYGLCMVGSFERDMKIEGYMSAFLESFYNSRHRKFLENLYVYTIKESQELGITGALSLAREFAKRYV